jgi:flagellar hook-length control protein FliK
VSVSASTIPSGQDIFITTSRATSRLYLVRAVLALVWAGVLGAALSSAGALTAGSDLPGFVVVLLIFYPALDMAASLHPAELGAVNVSATLRGDQLTVTVACSSDAARAAVTAALPNLHHQLAGAGFGGVDVQFGNPSQGQSQNASQNPGQAHREPAPGQDQPSGRHRASQQDGAPERRRAVHDAALDRLL